MAPVTLQGQTGSVESPAGRVGEIMNFEIIESEDKPIKAWTRGVQVEDAAKQQLRNLAGLPFIEGRHIKIGLAHA
jgi:hypothetical protein